MATIEIDGKTYEANVGQMLIEVTDANGIDIPRFCYHKKLSVAANCRMCLVEVEKAPKPMPACATPIMDGMKVQTRSPKALTAQKAVMEFLLINHPLDCPICDQGGECELQDIAVGYGKDASRYQETKRVVSDKSLGALIATDMTRCIHCTRCVRFSEEIAGIQELGATGRGEHTRIGTYIEKSVASELSGNVVDLCPVGALTSKPFRFSARAWEMQQRDGIAPHDTLGSHIHFHVRRNEVLRVVPKEHEAINEVWISDRDRFSYEGLNAADRLTAPMIKKDGQWQQTDWETALIFAAEGLKKVIKTHKASAVGALSSPSATLEELYLLQKLVRGVGSQNIDHRLRQTDFNDQAQAPLFPALGQTLAELESSDVALVIGSHLRKEEPLINHRLRKAALRGAKVLFVNPVDYEFNFKATQKLIVAPNDFLAQLAGIAKALLAEKPVELPEGVEALLASVTPSEAQQQLAKTLRAGSKVSVLLGNLVVAHPQLAAIRGMTRVIASLSGAKVGYLAEANSAGAWLAGAVPHRGAGGAAVSPAGLDAQAMLSQGLSAYVLLGVEPELDSCHGQVALNNLKKAEFVVSLTAYETKAMQDYADVLLPIGLYAETSGTYVNCEGKWQSFNGAVAPKGEARPAWKILRAFGNVLDVQGFEFISSEEVRDEVWKQVGDKVVNTQTAWSIPSSLEASKVNGSLQRITELAMYAVDALVRRADSLQRTPDALITEGVHVHPKLAARLALSANAQATVQQQDSKVSLAVVLDERVPEECVLLYAGQVATSQLGAWYGQVELSAS
ncbi:MAG: NADH-quinone oxidoreductase subunit NuoG [Thiotrichaceae bacterium]|nr:NADH-quinone oxidoreductase subunit NuoG [Thiotrichaceae bacterium]